MIMTCDRIAELLGGDVRGGEVLCPGPGHSAEDRSLSVKPDQDAPDGFVVHSFAGDDPIACRDHVRERLGLPPFEAKKKNGKTGGGAGGGVWTVVAEYVYRDAHGEPHLLVRKYHDERGEKHFAQFHWDGSQWLKGRPQGPKVLYNLTAVRAAAPSTLIYFCEGEKDCDALAKIGFVATTASEGAGAKWAPELTDFFRDRRIIVLPDADTPGRKHAQKVARALDPVAKSVKVLDLFPERSDGSDVSDWLKDDAVGVRLIKAVNDAPEWQPGRPESSPATAQDEALIAELATMSALDFAKRRKSAAARLGISVTDLDKFVMDARATKKVADLALLYPHWAVDPWDEPVEGEPLFRGLHETIRRFVVVSTEQATTVTLWLVYSWLHEHERFATHSPILLVKSPEKDSGKTTLLGVVSFLARRALTSVEISGPALFRSIVKWLPSLIVDEADDALVDNNDLRSVINSGWTRGAVVIRCHADTREPEPFATFAPKALGMKGDNLPDTTLSRSISVAMKPKKASEQVADFDHLDNETFGRLRRQLLRWTSDNADALAELKPEIPEGFHNRRRANWRPLLAIAELMGCKLKAWQAALAIEQRQVTVDDSSIGIQLLRDIKRVFAEKNIDRLTTGSLLFELIALPDTPWATYRHGREAITSAQVTKLLKPYDLKSGSVRVPEGAKTTCQGWLLAWFEDVFERYLTEQNFSQPEKSGSKVHTVHTTDDINDLEPEAKPTQDPLCGLNKSSQHVEKAASVDCVDFEAAFSGGLKKEEAEKGEDLVPEEPFTNPENHPAGPEKPFASEGAPFVERQPGEDTEHLQPADRTCALCRRPVDGTEHLVAIGDQPPVWLHRDCERPYLCALELDSDDPDEGRNPDLRAPDLEERDR
jgi:hypothetical protein